MARTEYVGSAWRAGVSAVANNTDAGDRQGAGVFGAFRAGPVTLLGEVDYIDDDSIGAEGRKLMASLAEADWKVRQGHNLKLTFEWLEPDRRRGRRRADAHEPGLRVVSYPVHPAARRGAALRRHPAERQPEPQTGIPAAAWVLLSDSVIGDIRV